MTRQQEGLRVVLTMLLQVTLLLAAVCEPCLSLPLPRPVGRRNLQQAGEAEEITIVTTARNLRQAIDDGATHIELQNHLDVSGIPLSARRSDTHVFGDLPPTVRSIRGNCSRIPLPDFPSIPATHAPLAPLGPNQCVLVTDQDMWLVNNTQLWMDALYVRMRGNALGADLLSLVKVEGQQAKAWMTSVRLEGTGDGILNCDVCGLHVAGGAAVYAEDCSLSQFGGVNAALSDEGFLSFTNCTFANNTIFPRDSGAAVIEAKAFADPLPLGEVRLQDCSFSGNQGAVSPMPILLADNRADGAGAFYSDSPLPAVCAYEDGEWNDPPPDCVNEAVLPLSDANGRPFINESNPTLLQIQAEVAAQLATRPGPRPAPAGGTTADNTTASVGQPGSSTTSDGNDGLSSAAIVGIVVACVAAAAAVVAVLVGPFRRRLRASNAPEGNDLTGFTSRGASAKMSASGSQGIRSGPALNSKFRVKSAGTCTTAHHTTTFTDPRAMQAAPDASADPDVRRQYLRYQLDTLRGQEVLDGLTFSDGRASGGQAEVQFAEHKRLKLEVAIKFFLHKVAFEEEKEQYEDEACPLRQFLPKCYGIHDNADGSFVDSNGRCMPACIVMERGESLDHWARRSNRKLDQFTCMQILHHICECLLNLHNAGYVHRDLKPGNIMWLPSQNRWTLIDFGCAATIGSVARAGFSLSYAAPEVVQAAIRDKKATIEASTALDAWSLGVLAVELFTGRPALVSFKEDREKVVAKIVGDAQLPWEEDANYLNDAGRFKDAVMTLLHRDPAQRAMVQTFMQQYGRIMSNTTQVLTTAEEGTSSTSQ